MDRHLVLQAPSRITLLALAPAALSPGQLLCQSFAGTATEEEKSRQQFADPAGLSGSNTLGLHLAAEVTEDGAKASVSATLMLGRVVGTVAFEAPFEKKTETSFVTLDGIESDVAGTLGLR